MEALKAQCPAIDASAAVDSPVADLQLVSDDLGDLQRQAADYTPNKDKAAIGENILGLRLLCLYGLKGAAAYMEHAHVLGQYDNAIYAQYHKNHGMAGHPACGYECAASNVRWKSAR